MCKCNWKFCSWKLSVICSICAVMSCITDGFLSEWRPFWNPWWTIYGYISRVDASNISWVNALAYKMCKTPKKDTAVFKTDAEEGLNERCFNQKSALIGYTWLGNYEMNLRYESCPSCGLVRSTCWSVVQCAAIVLRLLLWAIETFLCDCFKVSMLNTFSYRQLCTIVMKLW